MSSPQGNPEATPRIPELTETEVATMIGDLAVNSVGELGAVTGLEWRSDPVAGGMPDGEARIFGTHEVGRSIARYLHEPSGNIPGIRLAVERALGDHVHWPIGTDVVIEWFHYKQTRSGGQKMVVDASVRASASGYINNQYDASLLRRWLNPRHWNPFELYDQLSLASMQRRGRQFLALVRPLLIPYL